MRFESIKVRGLGVFKDEVSVDFASLPGLLCAVTGENGAGKSSLMELLFAGVYRDTVTRGSLTDLASSRDAFLEVRVVNGSSSTIRHVVDGVSKKSETLVLDETGTPVLSDTKVSNFDSWAKAHFPPREVTLSSLFAAQQNGGFIDLGARERKAVLTRILGIEELEGMAARARELATERRNALARVTGQLAALPTGDVVQLSGALEQVRVNAGSADRELAAGRLAHEAAIAYRAKAAQRIADEAALVDLEKRVARNRSILVDAPSIRAAATRFDGVRAELVQFRSEAELAGRDANDARRRQREASDLARRAQEAAQDARRRIDAAEGRLALRDTIEEARGGLSMALERVHGMEQQLESLANRQELLQSMSLGGATTRIEHLRDTLSGIATGEILEAQLAAKTAGARDDDLAGAQAAAPGKIKEVIVQKACIASSLTGARSEVSRREKIVARSGEMDVAAEELRAARIAWGAASTEADDATKEALRAGGEYEAAVAASSGRNAHILQLEDEEHAVAHLARTVEPLASAEVRLTELEPQAAALRGKIAALAAELDATAPLEVSLPDLEACARSSHAAVTRLEAELQRAQDASETRAKLVLEQRNVEAELADWTLLGEDLGTTGLPALLIDAAGPELTELVNDLLHTCMGPRFTLTIDTTRTSSDGKRQIETCEVRVLDTERGREDRVETFSGGERSLVGEAVSLALSMLACRRSGVDGPTLVRDETGAAFDEPNGRAYVAMLRRAAEIVGASRVLFITHDPQLQALADARLVVADGRITVQ